MNRNDLPSAEYVRRFMRLAQPVAPVESKPHPLTGKPRASAITPDEIHLMRRMKLGGALNKEIATATGRSQTAVNLAVRDLTKAKKGERESRAQAIRTLRLKGATWREIALATGASKDAIAKALDP